MKRKHLLTSLRVAGYHDDSEALTRLYVENRVSMPVCRQEYRKGQQMKEAGVRCTCSDCLPN